MFTSKSDCFLHYIFILPAPRDAFLVWSTCDDEKTKVDWIMKLNGQSANTVLVYLLIVL